MVRPEDVVDVDYTVEDAFKFIISFGIVGKDPSSPKRAHGQDATDDNSADACFVTDPVLAKDR